MMPERPVRHWPGKALISFLSGIRVARIRSIGSHTLKPLGIGKLLVKVSVSPPSVLKKRKPSATRPSVFAG